MKFEERIFISPANPVLVVALVCIRVMGQPAYFVGTTSREGQWNQYIQDPISWPRSLDLKMGQETKPTQLGTFEKELKSLYFLQI